MTSWKRWNILKLEVIFFLQEINRSLALLYYSERKKENTHPAWNPKNFTAGFDSSRDETSTFPQYFYEGEKENNARFLFQCSIRGSLLQTWN